MLNNKNKKKIQRCRSASSYSSRLKMSFAEWHLYAFSHNIGIQYGESLLRRGQQSTNRRSVPDCSNLPCKFWIAWIDQTEECDDYHEDFRKLVVFFFSTKKVYLLYVMHLFYKEILMIIKSSWQCCIF